MIVDHKAGAGTKANIESNDGVARRYVMLCFNSSFVIFVYNEKEMH